MDQIDNVPYTYKKLESARVSDRTSKFGAECLQIRRKGNLMFDLWALITLLSVDVKQEDTIGCLLLTTGRSPAIINVFLACSILDSQRAKNHKITFIEPLNMIISLEKLKVGVVG